jgi:photosystem II stability/assembly factor-like uncharacterized protein
MTRRRIERVSAFLLLSSLCALSVLCQSQTSPLIPSNSVSHIRVSGDTVWVGSSKGVARTVNQGNTWENFRRVPEFASNGIFAIALRGLTVWTSTGFEKQVNNSSVQTGSGLTFSLDGGGSWRHLPQPVDAQADSIIQYGINRMRSLPVTVAEQNVTFDISLTNTAVWISSFSSGLRRSTNNGQTWERTVLPPDNLNSIKPTDTLTFAVDPRLHLNLRAFSVLAVSDSEIWAGTAGGVNKSRDGGVSWTKFTHQNQDSSILGNWVIRIREQRFKEKRRIWVVNWKAEGPSERFGVSFTENSGLSWHNLLHDVKAYDFAFRDSIVYVATDNGVYRTDDDGRSWNRSSLIVDPTSHYRFTKNAIFGVGVQETTVWVVGDEGVAYTVDNPSHPFGETWHVFRTFQSVTSVTSAYAYPNPFSPDDEVVRLHFSTGGRDALVNVQIYDFGMNLVRTLLRGASRSGNREHDEIWDGRDDRGKQVANGVYFFRVETGADSPAWGKIIVLQ